MTPEEATAPGWYPDPRAPGRVRYWDGSAWTELARPVGDRALLTLPRQGRPVDGRLAWPPAGPRRALADRSRLVLAVAVGLVVLVLAGTALLVADARRTPGRLPPAATAAGDPAGQARALSALLDQAVRSRDVVAPTVAAVRACSAGDYAAARDRLVRAQQDRLAVQARLATLDLSALPEAAVLRRELAAAMQASADADAAFAAWAGAMPAGGCTVNSGGPDYERGVAASQAATAAKQRFVKAWNPVASRYGLPQRQAVEI